MRLPPSLVEALQISTAHGYGGLRRNFARSCALPGRRSHCIQGTIQRCPGTLLGARLMSSHAAKTTDASKRRASEGGSDLVTVRLRQLPARVIRSQPDYSSILLNVPSTYQSADESSPQPGGQVKSQLAAGGELGNNGVAEPHTDRLDVHALLESRRRCIGAVYSPSLAWQRVLTGALAELTSSGGLSDSTLQGCYQCLESIAQTAEQSSAQRLLRLSRLLADNAVASAANADLAEFHRRAVSLCVVLVEAVGRQIYTLTVPEYSALLRAVVQLHAVPGADRPAFSTKWWTAVMHPYRGSMREEVPPCLMHDFLLCTAHGWPQHFPSNTRRQLVDAARYLLSATNSDIFPTAAALLQFAKGMPQLTGFIVLLPEFLSAIPSLETIGSSEEAEMVMAIVQRNKTKLLDIDLHLSAAFINHLPVPYLFDFGPVLVTDGIVVPSNVLSAFVDRLKAEDLFGISPSQVWSLFAALDALGVSSQEPYCTLLKHIHDSSWTVSVACDPKLAPFARVVTTRLHGISQGTHLGTPEVVHFWKNYSKLAHFAIKDVWLNAIANSDAKQLNFLTKPVWDLACAIESDVLKVFMLETLAPHLSSPSGLLVLQQLGVDDVLLASASPLRSNLGLTDSGVRALSFLDAPARATLLPVVARHCLDCSEKHGFRYFFNGLLELSVRQLPFDSLVTIARALVLFNVAQNHNERHVAGNIKEIVRQNECHVAGNIKEIVRRLCRAISPRHANQYSTDSGLLQLLSIASACDNDPTGDALFRIAPEAVSSRVAWAEYLRPLQQRCARQTVDCGDIDEMEMAQVMRFAATGKQADGCHRLLFVLSEHLLAKIDTLFPENLRSVCKCLKAAVIDQESPTFSDLTANFLHIGRLVTFSKFCSASWHDAKLGYLACLHSELGVECDELSDHLCIRAVSKDIDLWKLVSVVMHHTRAIPYSLHETLLEQLSDPAAVSKNIPFENLFLLAEMLSDFGPSKAQRTGAWLSMRDVVLSEKHLHDEACVGNVAVELLKRSLHLPLSPEQVQPLVSTVLALPQWCLSTLRLSACNDVFLLPALKEVAFGDAHPYYDWFARIPSLICMEMAMAWKFRILVGYPQEQIETSAELFDFLESCSHAMAAAEACGTHVLMPYAFDIDTTNFRAMFDRASEGSPGTPLRTLVRLATIGLLGACASQQPDRHLLFETCMEVLADEQLVAAEGTLPDEGSSLGWLALHAAIQFQKQQQQQQLSSARPSRADGNVTPAPSPIAHLARVEANCWKGLTSGESQVISKYRTNGKNLFGILGSLFHDSAYIIEPSRLKLPFNVAAVCALDSAAVPLTPVQQSPQSADRPSEAGEWVWPVGTRHRVAWLVKPELNTDSGVDGLLDSLLLNCAALQLLEKSDFTIVEVPAELLHSDKAFNGKYVESTLSYLKRDTLRGLLTEKLRVL